MRTLARIRDLVARRFTVSCTIPGIRYPLRRLGWTCQLGARRAIERHDSAIEVEEADLAAGAKTSRAQPPTATATTAAVASAENRRAYIMAEHPVVRLRGRSIRAEPRAR